MSRAASEQKRVYTHKDYSFLPEGAPYQLIGGELVMTPSPVPYHQRISPTTAYYDLRHKSTLYAKHGVREYWIVDPMEKSIEIFENRNHEFLFTDRATGNVKVKSKLLQGFEVDIEEIF